MTFNEAKLAKTKLASVTLIQEGILFRIFIVPSHNKDFKNYLAKVRGYFNALTDEDALNYATVQDFLLCGLWFDGANIIYKYVEI